MVDALFCLGPFSRPILIGLRCTTSKKGSDVQAELRLIPNERQINLTCLEMGNRAAVPRPDRALKGFRTATGRSVWRASHRAASLRIAASGQALLEIKCLLMAGCCRRQRYSRYRPSADLRDRQLPGNEIAKLPRYPFLLINRPVLLYVLASKLSYRGSCSNGRSLAS